MCRHVSSVVLLMQVLRFTMVSCGFCFANCTNKSLSGLRDGSCMAELDIALNAQVDLFALCSICASPGPPRGLEPKTRDTNAATVTEILNARKHLTSTLNPLSTLSSKPVACSDVPPHAHGRHLKLAEICRVQGSRPRTLVQSSAD